MSNDKQKTFSEIYKEVKPSIVAICPKYFNTPDFPPIIGTGFVVDPDGVILTNNHVIDIINKLPKNKSKPNEIPVSIMLFHNIPGKGMATIHLEVEGLGIPSREKPIEGYNYGKDIPDVGVIYVKARGLPSLKISKKLYLEEGDEVMLSGFPMGTRTLRAPGWIHQLSPVLQKGIISTILPFVCENPHAIIVEAVTQGGSSGSPIFNPKSGEVVAILYGGILEPLKLPVTLEGEKIPYVNNTSLTLAIPSPALYEMYKLGLSPTEKETNEKTIRDIEEFDTLSEMLKTYEWKVREPKAKDQGYIKVDIDDITG